MTTLSAPCEPFSTLLFAKVDFFCVNLFLLLQQLPYSSYGQLQKQWSHIVPTSYNFTWLHGYMVPWSKPAVTAFDAELEHKKTCVASFNVCYLCKFNKRSHLGAQFGPPRKKQSTWKQVFTRRDPWGGHWCTDSTSASEQGWSWSTFGLVSPLPEPSIKPPEVIWTCKELSGEPLM